MDIYRKAYKEVIVILEYIPQSYVNRIPKDLIQGFKSRMDVAYIFNPEDDKPWLEETKAIIANIYRDYWATLEKKRNIEKKEQALRCKLDELKKEKYNPEDVFNNNKLEEKTVKNSVESSNMLIEIKQESFFKRILNRLLRIVRREKEK